MRPRDPDEVGGPAFDLRLTDHGRDVLARVRRFVADEVEPMSEEFFALAATRADRWSYAPGQLDLLDGVKAEARAGGLWNLFLSHEDGGEGLSNLDYAYVAAELGRSPLASECLNCSPPDSGNMEVLARVGTPEQQDRWLQPLLAGEIRSAFAMTEPDAASSDARNISCTALLDADEWVLEGDKYFVTGAGDPRCRVLIVMVRTDPDGPPGRQHSQILVPMDTPGVEIAGAMEVFGHDDAPRGHMHIRFRAARVPRSNVLLGRGRGFEVSQLRLGAGRIHHCMRSIGAAEKALELAVRRGRERSAFGRSLITLGKNTEWVARARIEIEALRTLVLRATKAMDTLGRSEARVWVSAVKATVPERVCRIIDEAIQIHGATGLSQWTPLAQLYAVQRGLRISDGPDEVHHMVVGQHEIGSYTTCGRWDAADVRRLEAQNVHPA